MGEVYRAGITASGARSPQGAPRVRGLGRRPAAALRARSERGGRPQPPQHPRRLRHRQRRGPSYLASELLEGESLRTRLAGTALPVRKALDYAIQIAQGLAAAHDKGIVHRDLKPENLFVTRDGRVKILDFGLAKLVRSEGAPVSSEDLTRSQAGEGTTPGTLIGTVGYMSPSRCACCPRTPAPTSSPSGRSSTRCSRGNGPSGERRRPTRCTRSCAPTARAVSRPNSHRPSRASSATVSRRAPTSASSRRAISRSTSRRSPKPPERRRRRCPGSSDASGGVLS